jgi:HPt (histidine-containing phosphotransfer) domain-containing protein
MMPDLDGTEATVQIRAFAGRDGAASPYASIPIVALSANAVQGVEEIFLDAGMNGFVSKPIEGASLNAALKKFLPEDKYTFDDRDSGIAAGEKLNEREESIYSELLKIEKLDIKMGFHYAADNFATYVSTLKQFSAGMEKGLAVIRNSLITGDWKSYTVQVHAYKGVCATMGIESLSSWGQRLEAASKSEDKSVCFEETEGFCSALLEFDTDLHNTSLFKEKDVLEKAEITASEMAAKIFEFVESCEEGRAARINAAVKDLAECRLAGDASGVFNGALAQTLDLARSVDYDEAAEKARELLVQVETSF